MALFTCCLVKSIKPSLTKCPQLHAALLAAMLCIFIPTHSTLTLSQMHVSNERELDASISGCQFGCQTGIQSSSNEESKTGGHPRQEALYESGAMQLTHLQHRRRLTFLRRLHNRVLNRITRTPYASRSLSIANNHESGLSNHLAGSALTHAHKDGAEGNDHLSRSLFAEGLPDSHLNHGPADSGSSHGPADSGLTHDHHLIQSSHQSRSLSDANLPNSGNTGGSRVLSGENPTVGSNAASGPQSGKGGGSDKVFGVDLEAVVIPVAVGGGVLLLAVLVAVMVLVWRCRTAAGGSKPSKLPGNDILSSSSAMSPTKKAAPDKTSASGMFEPGFTMIEVSNSLGDLNRSLTKVVVHMEETLPGGLSPIALRPPMLPVAAACSLMVQRLSVRHRLLAWLQANVWTPQGQYWPLAMLADGVVIKARKDRQYSEENYKNMLQFVRASRIDDATSPILNTLEQASLRLCADLNLNEHSAEDCLEVLLEMMRDAIILRLQLGATYNNAALTVSGCPHPSKGAWLDEFNEGHHNISKDYPVDPDYQAVAINPNMIVLFCYTPGVQIPTRPGAKRNAAEVLLRRMEDVVVLMIEPQQRRSRRNSEV